MQRSLRLFVLIVAVLSVALFAANLACTSVEGGVVNGRLKECPDSPNCVSSLDAREGWAVEPLDLGADVDAGWRALVELVEAAPRTSIETRRDDYVHAVCVSLLLRFRDDLELLLDRLPNLRLAPGNDFSHHRSMLLRGLTRLDLEFDPRT